MTGDGLSRGLSDMWRSLVLFLPYALAFGAIVLVGYLLARLARTVTRKALHRAGFDQVVRRGPAGRVFRGEAAAPSQICARIAYYLVLLVALQLAFGLWGPNPVSDLLNALIGWLPQLFVAIVIVVVAAAVAGAAHDLIASSLGGLGYARVLAKAAAVVIVTLGVIAGLDQVGIATSVTRPLLVAILATVAGVIVVGVGGGLIRPMQQRWEGWLDRAATESGAMRDQARANADERARLAAEEQARRAEEARLAEQARLAEEKRKAEEARLAEEARRAEEARKAEEARQAEEQRLAEQRRRAEEARLAEEARKAEEARLAEEVRKAEETRQAEARRAQEERLDQERRAEGERLEWERRAEAERPGDETQVIAVPRDDRPHLVPGFDRDDDDTTAVVRETEVISRNRPGSGDTTVVTQGTGDEEPTLVRLPDEDATVVIAETDEGERTQVVSLPPHEQTQVIEPGAADDEPRGGRPGR
ncbi:hypothetical protein [Actinoplanes sp. DH11]|uniref:mechanosensitive ion channel family protein n=1 Tax=Actinoplanes sp. DH11 TaxID=2857011 RepID=UPI001E64BE1E|nr:hypothetical protein [Actinoplanes sp. DH11]